MKIITKIATALSVAAVLFVGNVKAQTTPNPWRFGVGLDVGAPTGNLHNVSNLALGGTARLQYSASSDLKLMLTAGYYEILAKGNTATTQIGPYIYLNPPHDQGIIPVKVGIKEFFTPTWYFSAEAGAGFETRYNSDTKLILSPGLGYASKSWDVGLRYENFSGQSNNYGLVGIRLAYGFGI